MNVIIFTNVIGQLRGATGFILVYDVTAMDDRDYVVLERTLRQIQKTTDDEIMPIIVCLNKIDLLDKCPENRNILTEKIQQSMKQFDICNYEIVETSSKSNINVTETVEKMLIRAYFYDNGYNCYLRRKLLPTIVKKDKKIFSNAKCSIS